MSKMNTTDKTITEKTAVPFLNEITKIFNDVVICGSMIKKHFVQALRDNLSQVYSQRKEVLLCAIEAKYLEEADN